MQLLVQLLLVLATTMPVVQVLVQGAQPAGDLVATLHVDTPLAGESLDIGRTVRYHLRGLSASSKFEVRVSYPAVVRAPVSIFLWSQIIAA